MHSKQIIPITPILNIQKHIEGFIPLSISIGPKQDLLILLVEEQPPLVDHRFPATVTEEYYSYKVLRLKDGEETVLHLPNEQWNYHIVESIDDDHILLACARSIYHDETHVDQNGRVYDWDGNLIRSFCLGDGIDHMYTTRNNQIWTGYFDEGVYGNYGWKKPIGNSGLVGWDHEGNIIDDGNDRKLMGECLALNVAANDEIWYFIGIDAQIGLMNESGEFQFTTDALGFQTFAINGDTMVVHREYFDHHHFFELVRKANSYEIVQELEFRKPNGNPLQPQLTSNRADRLLFLDGSELYYYSIFDVFSHYKLSV